MIYAINLVQGDLDVGTFFGKIAIIRPWNYRLEM